MKKRFIDFQLEVVYFDNSDSVVLVSGADNGFDGEMDLFGDDNNNG